MSGKFQKQFTNATGDISALFNRSIRSALAAGIEAAVRNTIHDSSNAGYHWMVAERSRSRPGNRALGTVKDLRQTKGVRGPARGQTGTIGFQGDRGAHRNQTVISARMREREEVLDKMVSGRNVRGNYYFYHGLLSGKSDIENPKEYARRANLEAAGLAAIKAVRERFNQEVARGNVRVGNRAQFIH